MVISYCRFPSPRGIDLQNSNGEDQRYTKLLPRREPQAPDDLLWQDEEYDIRNEVDCATCQDDSVVIHASSKYKRIPYLGAWSALEDLDESASRVEQYVEPDDCMTSPEESTTMA